MSKNILLSTAVTLMLVSAFFFGCNNEKSPDVLNLESIRDSLEAVNNQRDGSINEFIKSLTYFLGFSKTSYGIIQTQYQQLGSP